MLNHGREEQQCSEEQETRHSTGRQQEGTPTAVTFHPTGEASPVGKDHQRQPLSVEVVDSLGCLKG